MGTVKLSGRNAAILIMGVGLAAFAVDALAVEEIVVTTRKREENLQSVPIAVQAITAADIEARGLVSLDKVIQQSSSVIFDQGFSPQDTRITIRGLAPTRGRQNVAVLQDGVDVSSEAGAVTAGGSLLINPRLFDLERIEIVKGPQIALYGRSAFAGAINYITRKPGDEFYARVGTDIGSYGQFELSGSVDGPLSDTVSAGISGMVWSRDGFHTNSLTGHKVGDLEGTSIAGTGVWKITEHLKATARIENLNDEFGVTPYANMPFNTTFAVPQTAIDGGVTTATTVPGVSGDVTDGDDLVLAISEDPRTCNPNVPNDGTIGCRDYAGSTRDVTRGTLDIDWDLGPVILSSLTHYADAHITQAEGSEDVSVSVAPTGGELFIDQDTTLFSQEIRLASNSQGRWNWLVGGLIWQERLDLDDGSMTCLNYTGFPIFAAGPQPCGPTLAAIRSNAPLDVPGDGLTPLNPDRWIRDTDHWSLFGLVEWQFLDSWKLTLEGRYSDEETTAKGPDQDNGIFDPSGTLCTFFGAPPCPRSGPGTDAVTGMTTVANARGGTESDSFFAPKVTVTWTPADNQMYYFSFAESFKPKGISTLLGGTGGFYDTECGVPGGRNPDCTDPIANFRFAQEKLDNYELGAKTSWLDNRLRLNGSVFFEDFKNKQVSTQVEDPDTGILSPRIVNAGAAEVWGADLEATWFATDNLTMSLNYTWLDTEYTRYQTFTTGSGTIAYVGNCTVTVVAGRTGCVVDYSGNELEGAPNNSAVGNVRWQAGLAGSTDYFLESTIKYQDDRYVSDKNQLVFPSYVLFDFRVGITNANWDIIAYVDNAFDDDTVKTGFEDGSIPTFFQTGGFFNKGTVILPDPRTYGLRVNYHFGK
ncbi:MAG: TonB-dependent receptor [Gammaproteobacteria bacterium]